MTARDATAPESLELPFPDVDLLQMADLLTDDEREALGRIRDVMQNTVRPVIAEFWNKEEFPFDLLPALADAGLGELKLQGRSPLYRGLAYAEVSRVDVSLSALVGIHNELILGMVSELGSDEQRTTWLDKLRRFEAVGSFGMTEPDHGSDIAKGIQATATPTDDGGWIINGEKRWIGAGTFADFILTWARDTSDDVIKAFLVRTDLEGFTAEKITDKVGLRVMQNAHITYDNVKISADDLLPGAITFEPANTMLRDSRIWVGWQAAGAQLGAFDVARDYAVRRVQFGKNLAQFQLIQQQLAEICANALVCLSFMSHVARLQENGSAEMVQAAMGKSTGSRLLRESAAMARNILGGDGIISTNEAAKILGDAEVVHTYEGTYEINSLIVGRALTGYSAFV